MLDVLEVAISFIIAASALVVIGFMIFGAIFTGGCIVENHEAGRPIFPRVRFRSAEEKRLEREKRRITEAGIALETIRASAKAVELENSVQQEEEMLRQLKRNLTARQRKE